MLIILANSSVYDLQRTKDIILVPDLFIWSIYLSVVTIDASWWKYEQG